MIDWARVRGSKGSGEEKPVLHTFHVTNINAQWAASELLPASHSRPVLQGRVSMENRSTLS
jgi:hypothetical protein